MITLTIDAFHYSELDEDRKPVAVSDVLREDRRTGTYAYSFHNDAEMDRLLKEDEERLFTKFGRLIIQD